MRFRSIVIATLLSVLSATGVRSQVEIVDPPDAVRYSLADCLRIALENNLDLAAVRKDPEIAQQAVETGEARFDGEVGANANYVETSSDGTITDLLDPNVPSTDARGDSDRLTLGASWRDLLDFGGEYTVALDWNDEDRETRGAVASSASFSESNTQSEDESLSLRYTMPLLNGFGREVNRIDIILAQSGVENASDVLRLDAITVAQDVENAYWDLTAARAALVVSRESLTLANDLHGLNKKKVEVGTLAPIEITQAEAGVASREEGVIVAETGVENAEDRLLALLAVPKEDPSWSRTVVPIDRPTFESRTVDVEAAIASAYERRLELSTLRRELRDDELSERVARKRVRPSLGLDARITPFASDTDDATTEVEFDPLGQPVVRQRSSNTDIDGDTWEVGLVFAYPIGNREAKANYATAALTRQKTETRLASLEQSIRVDVRTASRNVESGIKRVAAAESSSVLQRKTLEAEQKKFENGMSTSFEVLRIQTDLSNARLAEIRAKLDYKKALADLERAQGTLLEARGLSVTP